MTNAHDYPRNATGVRLLPVGDALAKKAAVVTKVKLADPDEAEDAYPAEYMPVGDPRPQYD